MHALLVLGFAAAFGALWLVGNRYKAGEGPLDRLPPGLTRPPTVRVETVADGTRYRVWDFASPDGRSFHVAEVKGEPRWVSFWLDPRTGKRTLYLSLATAGTLNDLRKDWRL